MDAILSAFKEFWSQVQDERLNSYLTRRLFLRLLGLIYLIAFLSLWTQIEGLIGRNGILPAVEYLEAISQRVGPERYWWLPTFCWLSASDGFLHLQCAAGTLFALLLVAGVAPVLDLVFLWALYLSLSTVCRDFLGFQWDILLLETGFLAIFLAPRQWLPNRSRETPPSLTVLWLARWLLFRLMFMSGAVKLLSADSTWWNLTALEVHYETQPLPTWIGWHAHQLPAWFQKMSVLVMFVIELGLPVLIFGLRHLRAMACGGFLLLMLVISLSGNYCFFNLLTVALCLLLLDDRLLRRFLPNRITAPTAPPAHEPFLTRPSATLSLPVEERGQREGRSGRFPEAMPAQSSEDSLPLSRFHPLRVGLLGLLALMILLISGVETLARLTGRERIPPLLLRVVQAVSSFRTVNSYGLFAVMTTTRPEIIVEGSNDGSTWLAYEFKWKPGEAARRPVFVAPHQPRLDWQMWFAALGTYRQNPWFMSFLVRLLQGSPDVSALLARNPFPDKPPRRIRAVLYEYRFTDRETRVKTGHWWRRERKGIYCPEIALRQE
jgi:hypothetical protein